jgi:ADP-heptose:LPS heptosyltransferase
MTWSKETSQENETAKIRWELPQYTRGVGLDIGCGAWKGFPHFIGVDNGHHETYGQQIKPDIKMDGSKLTIFASQSLDFIYSSHLLEHFPYEQVPEVLKEWWRTIKIGGHLCLYLPSEDLYPKVGEYGANGDHKWNVNEDKVIEAMPGHWDLLRSEKRGEADEYSIFLVFKRLSKGREFSYRNPKPKKTCGLCRYGAFGDNLMASSVLAGLKQQGYHITMYASPPGVEAILHDPNVDKFYLQDRDQVPNFALGDFWANEKKKYDKWVNLSETMEGTFLALPGRTPYEWRPDIRHKHMNVNYLEHQHLIAGVPHNPQVRFYATPEEKEWAKRERSKMGSHAVVWSLAGSSTHKTHACLDQIIARLMISYPKLHVVLVGGPEATILEAGWENEPRVHRTCGKWSIRNTLAFLDQADLVVGPETGVLNAASHLSIPKLVFLSHSTVENLTRDWTNTISLSSKHTVCPGRGNNEAPACHQLHYGWVNCKKTEKGVAQCQDDISNEEVWENIQKLIEVDEQEEAA